MSPGVRFAMFNACNWPDNWSTQNANIGAS